MRAAARAFEDWGQRSPIQRAKVLFRWADLLEAHVDELGLLETRDMGMAIGDARWCVGNAAAVMRYYAGAVDKFFGTTIPVDRDGVLTDVPRADRRRGADHALELPAQHRQLEDGAGDRGRQLRRPQARQPLAR